jgi:hypothetical protein
LDRARTFKKNKRQTQKQAKTQCSALGFFVCFWVFFSQRTVATEDPGPGESFLLPSSLLSLLFSCFFPLCFLSWRFFVQPCLFFATLIHVPKEEEGMETKAGGKPSQQQLSGWPHQPMPKKPIPPEARRARITTSIRIRTLVCVSFH